MGKRRGGGGGKGIGSRILGDVAIVLFLEKVALELLKQIFASSDELYLPDATHFVAVEEAAAIARALVTFTSFLRPEGGLRLARML